MSKKRKLTEQVGVMFGEETSRLLTKVTEELEVAKSEFVRNIVENKLKEMTKETNNEK